MYQRGLDIAQDLGILYELSLSIGTSLDVRTNSDRFLKALMIRKNLDFAAVWLRDLRAQEETYVLTYANPKALITEERLSPQHPMVKRLRQSGFWTVEADAEDFEDAITERLAFREGTYAIFRLGTLGILKLYDSKRRIPFFTRELNQLKTLADKFATSLEGCMAHQTLLEEMAERKRTTQRLTESETRKSAILESALDAIITIDEFARILEFNPAAERIFGYMRNEVLGKSLAEELLAPEYRDSLRSNIQKYLRSGEAPVLGRHMEIRAVHKNGAQFPVELAVTPIELNGKRLFTAYIRDITERKRADSELRKANELAEQSVRSKERFLANMSHEMRTPLNAVIGLTHLLEETSLTRQQSRYLEAIQFSAGSLLALINDILDFAKIDAGKIEFEQVPFRLDDTLNGLYAMLRFTAERKGLALKLVSESGLPVALIGDQVRLRQILLNLIGNAIKFTEKGHVQLSVRLLHRSKGKATLEFAVEDTGIGISEDKLAHIFDSFSQASSDTTRKYGGTGLGLAIVKELVEQQGGQIEVSSEVGKGSSFKVIVAYPETTEDRIALAPEIADEPDHSLEGVRVLVVEDNDMNQFVAHQMLTRWGCKVEIAEGGRIAIEKVQANPFDIVLMDIQMPDMDGFATTRHIRQNLGYAADRLPIIALTASMLADNRQQVFEAGMNDFLLKPFDPANLRRILKLHWGKVSELRGREEKVTPTEAVQKLTPVIAPSAQPVLPDQTSRSSSTAKPVNSTAQPIPTPLPKAAQPPFEVRPTPQLSGDSLVPLINLQGLMENALGNKDFAIKVIDLFLMQTPEQLMELMEYWRRGEMGQVKFIAHKMKSSARLLGMEPLAQHLDSLETDLATGKTLRLDDQRLPEIIRLADGALSSLRTQREQLV